jgi:hypothetical protein
MLIEIKNGVRTNPMGRGMIPRIMVLKCDVCQSTYERPYSKHHFDEKIHRCSRKCVYGSRSTDGLGGHGAKMITFKCAWCNKPSVRREIDNNSTGNRGMFCDSMCYGNWLSTHPDTYSENTIKMHTPEVAQKISDAVQERMRRPDYVHPRLGSTHSSETKALLRLRHEENPLIGEKNGMFGRTHSGETREKMSDKKTQLILAGKFKPYGTNNKKGIYISNKTNASICFKSSWEEAVMKYLDADSTVTTWAYESIRIPYMYDNNKRWYVPDFIVTFADGQKEIWEVKPKEFLDSDRVMRTTEAGRLHCEQNNTQYRILTGDILKKMSIL